MNLGSVLAAGLRCEMDGFMEPGLTVELFRAIRHQNPISYIYVQTGYEEGLRRKAVYSKLHRIWVEAQVTKDACEDIGFAISTFEQVLAPRSITSTPTAPQSASPSDVPDSSASLFIPRQETRIRVATGDSLVGLLVQKGGIAESQARAIQSALVTNFSFDFRANSNLLVITSGEVFGSYDALEVQVLEGDIVLAFVRLSETGEFEPVASAGGQ